MKALKLSLLAATLATSSLAMAQDKAALIKQFLELQRPGVEALARGLVEESSLPVARAGAGYLQTQVPEAKREAAGKAADAELKKYFDSAYPIVRDKAVQVAPAALTPVLEQNFSEEELRQLVAWINSPVSKKYQEVNPQLQAALAEKVVADTRTSIEPKLEQLDKAVAKALGAPAAPAGGAKAPAAAPAKK
ncbi:DUF2059 domain-containing protein [Xenophilus arseniciresistens]|uniref:DUF2059 domain-containing protein n=1 Tax=Xenophilus arseniciresistens TaxID=1283306 RepID=A0AAE3SYQ3_9BURK|nr:DUF2059 domain-containing protein [Xenophilus arseniciresistens]MDA7415041.1 DUF2059 domain-containing protein [Xenophilus arseniciresistens]